MATTQVHILGVGENLQPFIRLLRFNNNAVTSSSVGMFNKDNANFLLSVNPGQATYTKIKGYAHCISDNTISPKAATVSKFGNSDHIYLAKYDNANQLDAGKTYLFKFTDDDTVPVCFEIEGTTNI